MKYLHCNFFRNENFTVLFLCFLYANFGTIVNMHKNYNLILYILYSPLKLYIFNKKHEKQVDIPQIQL